VKPHIRKDDRGVWLCQSPYSEGGWLGVGETPLEAYSGWLKDRSAHEMRTA
jgi:hypothetical protein